MGGAIDYIRKDFFIIVVCLVAVLFCLLTYLPAKKVIDRCNADCLEQFNDKCKTGAEYIPYAMNDTIDINFVLGGDEDASKGNS